MHTVWVRLNAVVFFGLTVLLVLAVLTWLSTLVVGPDAAERLAGGRRGSVGRTF